MFDKPVLQLIFLCPQAVPLASFPGHRRREWGYSVSLKSISYIRDERITVLSLPCKPWSSPSYKYWFKTGFVSFSNYCTDSVVTIFVVLNVTACILYFKSIPVCICVRVRVHVCLPHLSPHLVSSFAPCPLIHLEHITIKKCKYPIPLQPHKSQKATIHILSRRRKWQSLRVTWAKMPRLCLPNNVVYRTRCPSRIITSWRNTLQVLNDWVCTNGQLQKQEKKLHY